MQLLQQFRECARSCSLANVLLHRGVRDEESCQPARDSGFIPVSKLTCELGNLRGGTPACPPGQGRTRINATEYAATPLKMSSPTAATNASEYVYGE